MTMATNERAREHDQRRLTKKKKSNAVIPHKQMGQRLPQPQDGEGPYPGGALLALLRRPSHWKRRLHKRLPAAIDPVAGLTLLQIKRNTRTSRCVIMRVTPNSITCHTCNQGTTMEHAQGWTLHTTDVRQFATRSVVVWPWPALALAPSQTQQPTAVQERM